MSALLPKVDGRSRSALVHGHARGTGDSPTYISWCSMHTRCRNWKHDIEGKHARRGISVCAEWQSFTNFLRDMGERPNNTTLDRIDNDSNYYPGNCRWATATQQARNRRNTRLTFEQAVVVALARLNGETCKSLAMKFGISESLPREIVKGRTWPDALEEARRRLNGTA